MWHVTRDMWHVTRDMWRDTWHMTCDMFGGVNILSKFQLSSSYGLWFMILWISGGKGSVTESVKYEAVYRTAPATPGLLTRPQSSKNTQTWIKICKIHDVDKSTLVFGFQ